MAIENDFDNNKMVMEGAFRLLGIPVIKHVDHTVQTSGVEQFLALVESFDDMEIAIRALKMNHFAMVINMGVDPEKLNALLKAPVDIEEAKHIADGADKITIKDDNGNDQEYPLIMPMNL